ncbi:MAG TPA: hypothetical protein VNG51_28440 [Ktedonobacteraceae bacterium]|nr:hypothetical protein [Ktedonobacteraceae bacterium]
MKINKLMHQCPFCRGRFIAPSADLSRPAPIYRAQRRFIAPSADLSRPAPIYRQCPDGR